MGDAGTGSWRPSRLGIPEKPGFFLTGKGTSDGLAKARAALFCGGTLNLRSPGKGAGSTPARALWRPLGPQSLAGFSGFILNHRPVPVLEALMPEGSP
jgi:hypothetical protein